MKDTKIEWCKHTFNPWVGCSAVSAGCEKCYARVREEGRFHRDFSARRRTTAGNWRQPVLWNKAAKAAGKMETVFCGSMCDWLDEKADANWRLDLWALIQATPNLFWLLLTKRPEKYKHLTRGYLPPNVGIGLTVENQAAAEVRMPLLMEIPAVLRFVSVEPMLEKVDLMPWLRLRKRSELLAGWMDREPTAFETVMPAVGWVICGAETGPGARPMDMGWAQDLERQCGMAMVPFFFKKASKGEWRPVPGRAWPKLTKKTACCAALAAPGTKKEQR